MMILLCVDLLYRFHRIYDCRKNFAHYTNILSNNGCKKNEKIKYKYFKDTYGKRKRDP